MADLWFRNLTLNSLVVKLDITFVASDQIDNVLRFTMELLSDRIAPACSSAGKII